MKKILTTPLFILLLANSFGQDLNYEIHGRYTHPIKKETLLKAQFMSDIIPYYPSEWIMGYTSVEILTTRDGKEKMAMSANDTLTTEQKNILKTADLGTDIVININYKRKNWASDKLDDSKMNYSATVVPETEAVFPGGNKHLTQYLKESAIDKIPETTSKQIQPAIVRFTVNEEGETTNAQISRTSGDLKTDDILLEVINKMPRWTPAEEPGGVKVRQDFEFSVGSGGC